MFDLSTSVLVLLIICIVFACLFEFINGFHDTANAVATVIYTNTLKPGVAVVWSGIFNFFGVFAGGIAVAMGIVDLLPVEMLLEQSAYNSIAMVLALVLSAIVWNFGTWYFGIPASSSHTLIGSILGVGLAFSLLPGNEFGSGVNWSKASDIGLSLLVSPLFGFGMTMLLLYVFTSFVTNKRAFESPKPGDRPPLWIRGMLIFTCTGVSFFHGSNDGQKGVGLVMLILIGVVPVYFALNESAVPSAHLPQVKEIRLMLEEVDAAALSAKDRETYQEILVKTEEVEQLIAPASSVEMIPRESRFHLRSDILYVTRKTDGLVKSGAIELDDTEKKHLKSQFKGLREITDYAPTWVLVMISLSLGIGTMVGWKRIVVTVGEKIGKTHMTYAQGASAELVAASTIGLSTYLGLPVSTTHVLSSGIAGSMVASSGLKNLQRKTVRNILLAWVLTLPVTMLLSALLFLFFRQII